MRICIIGMGYIGLPTAAIFASKGHQVVGTDVNTELLEFIREKGAPPEEPGLSDIVLSALSNGSLTLMNSPQNADILILCLPTPITHEKKPDLSFVEKGMNSLLPILKKGDMIILESTVPPGTTAGLISNMVRKKGFDPVEDVDLVFAPERVIPGNILKEIQNLDRVMGGLTERASERARELYSCFVNGQIYLTDATTAEFVKLVENSYRDVNIAFANELAKFSPELGIDIWEAIDIANKHPRVNIHTPGPGVGGHCIAVDPYFIIDKVGKEKAQFLSLARSVNTSMPEEVVSILQKKLENLEGKKVSILGVAYKGNVGDSRESPSLDIIRLLDEKGTEIKVHDPFVENTTLNLMDLEEVVSDSEAVIITTNHDIFKNIEPDSIAQLVSQKFIFDTKNIIDRKKWVNAGWEVLILGSGK